MVRQIFLLEESQMHVIFQRTNGIVAHHVLCRSIWREFLVLLVLGCLDRLTSVSAVRFVDFLWAQRTLEFTQLQSKRIAKQVTSY